MHNILMMNPLLHGKMIRDLRLPLDVLIMSVNRNGHMIISHGYTMIELGDRLTMVGSEKALQEVTLQFET